MSSSSSSHSLLVIVVHDDPWSDVRLFLLAAGQGGSVVNQMAVK